MSLTRVQKEDQVKEIAENMKKASSVMFAQYIGLTVAEVSDLRQKLRKGQAEMKVGKKTLMLIAAKDAGLPEVSDEQLEGPVSLIFSFGDPISGAQIAFAFGKDHEQVKLIGGIFDGKVLTKEETVRFAKIPGRIVLLATFAGMIRSPLTSFAMMCGSPLSGFARAIKAMSDKGGFVKSEAPAVQKTPPPTDQAGDQPAAPAAEDTATS